MKQNYNEELIEIYLENADKEYWYKSFDEYIKDLEKIYNKYCVNKSKEEQIIMSIKILGTKPLLSLGIMLSLKEKNMELLNNVLYTCATIMQLSQSSSGYDHCIFAWNLLPILFSANKIKDIEKIFPKKSGLSNNGYVVNRAITNLVMYLYYKEEVWKEQVLQDGYKVLKTGKNLEEKAVVACLISLVEKDFERFRFELSNIYKGRRQSKLENVFMKQFSFLALGLYNFAYYLYKEEIEKFSMLEEDNLILDLHLYQKSIGFKSGGSFIEFKEPIELFNDIINVDIPAMPIYIEKGKKYTDIQKYQEEIVSIILSQ